jgi:Fur family peroxide stress response transcriptional regulator
MERRMTRQRQLILDTLNNTTDHPTADMIYRMLQEGGIGIGLATVYRNLNYLAEEGIIHKVTTPHSSDHFDGNITPHYHAVCQSCGEVADVFLEPDGALMRQAEEACGYQLRSHEVIFYGMCKKCRDKNNGGK